ncbi:unnamed protein product [Arabis nemorensis]|uniref:Thioglucosidase n=1 Tax=Arabis nemorensis TaxID=586526 RepID=A0A565B9I5_9BRAS|nr:unnamed protein product [Arabis nemorensis]
MARDVILRFIKSVFGKPSLKLVLKMTHMICDFSFIIAKNGTPIGPRAHSEWLYNVPWGMYKALMYIKERYGNPTMILSENGMDDPGNITLAQGLNDTTRTNYY